MPPCGYPPPPPPPPPPDLPVSTFTRDYQASCEAGYRPRWTFFSWQALIPPPSTGSIDFKAQTAATVADLDAAPQVGIGTADTTTTTWTSDPNTVEWHLNNDIPDNRLTSQALLRVSMTFNPDGPVSPVLLDWRQAYDCVPAE